MKRLWGYPALATLAMLLLTGLAYWPGLSGGFLFDDYANLPALGATGPVGDWNGFWRYITSGRADPLGRPLSLLSFLLDARDWPAAPLPFKRTNLLVHLANASLLARLLYELYRARAVWNADHDAPARQQRLAIASILGASFWALHPLLVSTTLYVVQREAMLSTLFTLLGLILWLRGRRALLRGDRLRGITWILTALVGCTVLAMLSKANGVLLPALALIIELALLKDAHVPMKAATASAVDPTTAASNDHRRIYRLTMMLFAGAPTLAVTAYLLRAGLMGMSGDMETIRPWTLGQRLLTQPRVLMDYLRLLWAPRPFTSGVFNDHIVPSTSLLSPWTTLPALIALVGLIGGAVLFRRRWPAITLAMAFYLVAQSLESSTIPLELYFEHRNYLPAILMFWPLALWLCGVTQRGATDCSPAPQSERGRTRASATLQSTGLRAFIALLLLVGLGSMTYARASLWGNTNQQVMLWARLNPGSARAQVSAASVEAAEGRPLQSVARLQSLLKRHPDDVQAALGLITARCRQGHLDAITLGVAESALEKTPNTGTLLVDWFGNAIDHASDPICPDLTLSTIDNLLRVAAGNRLLTRQPGRRQDLLFLRGRMALAADDPAAALAAFNKALDQRVYIAVALRQAAILGAAGFPAQGIAHLDHYAAERQLAPRPGLGMARLHAWVLEHQHYWDNESARLRHTLQADLQAKRAPSP
ncbi:tetratricopeptide repeat protein [Dyella sp.]|jgi:hypothetical protein|uniref:tetratricopeptide repeat protein n=1 Tax=Dyella sp. TaxID=1869338 RepID=UPI002D78EFA8|nr:tetratricopeptide repeat protein [Dyella sp.]HET6433206.1 tetratricopeptide repeat protein [Dyella sp.]